MNDCRECPSMDPCFAKKRNINGELVCTALQEAYPDGECPFQKAKREYKAPKAFILRAYEKTALGRKHIPGTKVRDEDLRSQYDRLLQPLRRTVIRKYGLLD